MFFLAAIMNRVNEKHCTVSIACKEPNGKKNLNVARPVFVERLATNTSVIAESV
jgi:hypothetical protein